jgi:hypothetical protein
VHRGAAAGGGDDGAGGASRDGQWVASSAGGGGVADDDTRKRRFFDETGAAGEGDAGVIRRRTAPSWTGAVTWASAGGGGGGGSGDGDGDGGSSRASSPRPGDKDFKEKRMVGTSKQRWCYDCSRYAAAMCASTCTHAAPGLGHCTEHNYDCPG